MSSRSAGRSERREEPESAVRAMIAAERGELADLLDGLSAEQWNELTLCAGWRVGEVVAHITMAFRYSTLRVVIGMLKARGSFNRMADRAAHRDAEQLSPDELVACLRSNVHHGWKPPGGGYVGALSHDLIHGLDITWDSAWIDSPRQSVSRLCSAPSALDRSPTSTST